MPVLNPVIQRGWKVARYNKAAAAFEWVFWIFTLMYSTGAIVPMAVLGKLTLVSIGPAADRAAAFLQTIWAVDYVIFFVIAATRANDIYRVIKATPAVNIVLPAVMLLSGIYAATPELSLQRSVTTIIGSVMGIYLGVRYPLRDILKLAGWALVIAMLSSAYVMLFMGNYGIMDVAVPGAWSGSFQHKNSLGHMGLLSLVLFGYFFISSKGYAKLPWIGLILMVIWLMSGAKSATANIGIFLMLGVAYLLNSVKRRSEDFVLIVFGAVVALASAFPLLTLLYQQVLEFLGKDITLTGRTDLWALTTESFLHKPFIGWGYDNFWENTEPYGGLSIRSQLGWMVPHAHNSWIELGLQIGVIGVALYARMLFSTLMRAVALARMTLKPEYALVIVFICYILMFSIGERVFLLRNDIRHIMLAAFFALTYREVLAFEPERQTGAQRPGRIVRRFVQKT